MTKRNYKVEEIYAGCCTGTIRGPMLQRTITKAVKEGWKFDGTQSVTGRKCCSPYYVLLVVFSKEETIEEVAEV